MHKPSLLVVEDEPSFARLMTLSLRRDGFEVHAVTNGEDAIDLAAEIHPDAIVLDLGLPGMHGLDVLAEFRERTNTPIIVVTGARTTEAIRRGLDNGADDYVTKPFSPNELAARLRAVLRRRHGISRREHRIGECIVDLEARTIRPAPDSSWPGAGRSIGRAGWRLLEAFLRNEGRILYRDELLETAFGPEYRGDSGYLQEHVRRLRRGLGIPAGTEGAIRTVRGVGYAYDAAGEIPLGQPGRRQPVDRGTAKQRTTGPTREARRGGVRIEPAGGS